MHPASLRLTALALFLTSGVVVFSSCSSAVTITATRLSGVVFDTSIVLRVGTIMGNGADEFKEQLLRGITTSSGLRIRENASSLSESPAVLRVEGTYLQSEAETYKDVNVVDKTERYRVTTYTATFDYSIVDLTANKRVIDGRIGLMSRDV